MRSTGLLLVFLVAGVGCSERQAGEEETSSALMPEWSPCAMKGEVQTCAELCTSEGMVCVANGCPATPEFCDPEPCDMATQVLALDAPALCADPSLGGFVATTCDAPIEWLFSNTIRCCCATQD